MLLQGKTAVIYGGYGAVGAAVARRRRGEDPRGRRHRPHRRRRCPGREPGRRHADAVAGSSGGIDISFNAISLGDVHGTPLVTMSLESFERPVRTVARTMSMTTRAAARHMVRQRSGVLLFFGGDDGHDPMRDYYIGGFQVAIGLVDTLRRQLAAELGPHGVRAVTLQTGGIIEAMPTDDAALGDIAEMIVEKTMLKRAATFEDVGNVAAFVCSDKARSIIAASVNITAGAVAD